MSLKCCFCAKDAIDCRRLVYDTFNNIAALVPVCATHRMMRHLACDSDRLPVPMHDETPVLQLVSAALWRRFVAWIEQNARERSQTIVIDRGPDEVFGHTGHFNAAGEFVPDGLPPKKLPAIAEIVGVKAGRAQFRNVSGREIKASEVVRLVDTSAGTMQDVDGAGQIKCWTDGCDTRVTPKADELALCDDCRANFRCHKCGQLMSGHMLGVSPLFRPICPAPKLASRRVRCGVHVCNNDAVPAGEFCKTHYDTGWALASPAKPRFAPGPECDRPPVGWRCTRGKGHGGPCAAWPTNATGGRKCSWATCQEDAMPGEPACVNHLAAAIRQDVPDTAYPPAAARLAELARESPTVQEFTAGLKAQREAYFDRLATRAAEVITPEVAAGMIADAEVMLGAEMIREIDTTHGGTVDQHDLPADHPDSPDLGTPGE